MDPHNRLSERLGELIAEHRHAARGRLATELDRAQGFLEEPLKVAVVGRVKAGKSTVVNALLGQSVAPTDVSECTTLVTWFRYGHPQRAVIQLEGGRSKEVQLTPEGRLPETLSTEGETARSVEVYLANEALRSLTLIDTPGIGSVHEELSRSTKELVTGSRPRSASASADAVVMLLSQTIMADDLEALGLLRPAGAADSDPLVANAIGVLSRADQLGDGRQDAWAVAVGLAARHAERLRGQLDVIVPVMGLLAETAETAALTENDARHLRLLAAVDPKVLDQMLWTADRFLSADLTIEADARRRLLTLLDLFGIGRAVELVRGGAAGAAQLRRRLSEISGIATLKQALLVHVQQRGQLARARAVFDQLYLASFGQGGDGEERSQLSSLRDDLEVLLLSPAFHRLVEEDAWRACSAGIVGLSDELLGEARRLFGFETDPRSVIGERSAGDIDATTAEVAMVRWRRELAVATSPVAAQVAAAVLRSYQLALDAQR